MFVQGFFIFRKEGDISWLNLQKSNKDFVMNI